jgi:DNA-binding MarR family transcriptional regulator
MEHQRALSATARRTTDSAPSADDIAELAGTLGDLMRTFNRARQQFLAKARYNVEWSAQVLMSAIVSDGPIRVGALAEIVQSDPSTVSRQVAQLVKDGYVERRADPDDGRASLLVATEHGHALHHEHLQVRNEHYELMLADWGDRDVRKLTSLMRRFVHDYISSKRTWLDNEPSHDAAPAASQREG